MLLLLPSKAEDLVGNGVAARKRAACTNQAVTRRAEAEGPAPKARAGAGLGQRPHQTGMRWPHHSCRLMHQSRMFSSQALYVALNRSGSILIAPLATAYNPNTLSQSMHNLLQASLTARMPH